MPKHAFTFIPCPSKDSPVEAQCSCGVILPAKNGTDAVRIAKVHIDAEREKEIGDAITT